MARIVPAAGDANHVKGWDNGTQVTVKVPTQIRRAGSALAPGRAGQARPLPVAYSVSCASRATWKEMKCATPASWNAGIESENERR